VIAALGREVAGLTRRLEGSRSARDGACRTYVGSVLGVPVKLAVTGMGADRASRGARALLSATPLRALLSLGFAGALDGDLAAGALSLPERLLLDGDPSAATSPDATLRARLVSAARQAGLEPRGGSCVTAESMVTDPGARAALGAAHGAALVDMEGYWLAREAAAAGVPFASARAVSDALSDHHPVLAGALRGGGMSVTRLLRGYAARPREATKLPGLMRNARAAAGTLERFALAALRSLALETVP